jgi:hypothetical protein
LAGAFLNAAAIFLLLPALCLLILTSMASECFEVNLGNENDRK